MAALVLFGGGGDLAMRMLLPSLYFLEFDGLLPDGLKIIGAARSDESREDYVARVRTAVEGKARTDDAWSEEAWARLDARLDYLPVDATDPASLKPLKDKVGDMSATGGVTSFLAVSPSLYGRIVTALKAAGLANPTDRVVLEKPVGRDLKSFLEIDDAVAHAFSEDQVFRIDHYLGKETVQNLIALRFGNTIFEPLWNSLSIDHVQITVAETLGVGDRWPYYDEYGALRDMLQNHMLQLLCLVAMRVDIDNWRWAGTPFFLRTGKRLAEKRTEIVIQFKPVPHSIFDHRERGHIEANRLVIELQPEEDIALSVMNKKPGLDQRMQLQPIQMSLSWGQGDKAAKPPRRRIAYERLLLDALSGDSTLFVRRDEAEQAWKWVDEVSDAWRSAAFKPKEYAAGTWGPADADLLLERGGREWNTGHG